MDWKKNGKIINIFPLSIRIWKSEEMGKKIWEKMKVFQTNKNFIINSKRSQFEARKSLEQTENINIMKVVSPPKNFWW